MKKSLIFLMGVGRNLFRNTPVQRLRLTTWVYRRLAKSAFGSQPIEVQFRDCLLRYPGGDHTTLPTLVSGSYEEKELDHLQAVLDSLQEPIVAVDVGANVGIWSVILAKHPMVRRVIAFEPSPQNIDFLVQNLSLNRVEKKVQVIAAAVSDHNGDAHFDSSGSGATMRLSEDGDAVVSVVSLNEVLKDERVGLIKIDVEGFEVSVLNGAWHVIERDSPNLYIEYSIPQTESAGRSWSDAGARLIELYGLVTVIDGGASRSFTEFDRLLSDRRLLNLFFQNPTSNKP